MMPAVKSFADGSRKLPHNARVAAAMEADATRRKTNLPHSDPSRLVSFLAEYYEREQILHPPYLLHLRVEDLKSPEDEAARLLTTSPEAPPQERQLAIYRLFFSLLRESTTLPTAAPRFQ